LFGRLRPQASLLVLELGGEGLAEVFGFQDLANLNFNLALLWTGNTPFELGCRPSPAASTPALTNSSLKLPMAVSSCSSGIAPASVFASDLSRIMKRM
jgi:hypothetical protein